MPDEADDWEIEPRRPKGWLQSDIEGALKVWIAQEAPAPFYGKPMTPHRACDLLVQVEELDPSARPSSGAVNNIFVKWRDCGYATFSDKPFAFVAFTEEGLASDFDTIWKAYKGIKPNVAELERQHAEAEAEAKRLEALAESFDAE